MTARWRCCLSRINGYKSKAWEKRWNGAFSFNLLLFGVNVHVVFHSNVLCVCVQQQNVTKTIRSQSMVESTNTNVTEHNGIVLSVIFHYLAEFSHHSVRKRVEIVWNEVRKGSSLLRWNRLDTLEWFIRPLSFYKSNNKRFTINSTTIRRDAQANNNVCVCWPIIK